MTGCNVEPSNFHPHNKGIERADTDNKFLPKNNFQVHTQAMVISSSCSRRELVFEDQLFFADATISIYFACLRLFNESDFFPPDKITDNRIPASPTCSLVTSSSNSSLEIISTSLNCLIILIRLTLPCPNVADVVHNPAQYLLILQIV